MPFSPQATIRGRHTRALQRQRYFLLSFLLVLNTNAAVCDCFYRFVLLETKHACLSVPGPPNRGLSRQCLHFPHASPRFPSPCLGPAPGSTAGRLPGGGGARTGGDFDFDDEGGFENAGDGDEVEPGGSYLSTGRSLAPRGPTGSSTSGPSPGVSDISSMYHLL